jgi:predicted SAM-dependent methyltransferase
MTEVQPDQADQTQRAQPVDPLDLAMQSYMREDIALGQRELVAASRLNPNLHNPHLLMRAIRRYAFGLLRDPVSPAEPAVQLMRAVLAHLPDEVSALRPFARGELSDWLLTAAYHEYKRGELGLTRSYVIQAIGITPQLLADRGTVSLLLQSLLGQRAIRTYRTAQPRGLAKRTTLDQRSRLIADYLRIHDVVKVHVGCGDNLLDAWLNTDLSEMNRGGVVYLDATQPLPFENGTVDLVFSEHMIEHLGYQEGVGFLNECYRVLKPGGVCRIATPTFEFLNELYNDRTGKYSAYLQWSIDQWVGGEITTPVMVVNGFVRNWGHQFIYDSETLTRIFRSVGFVEIARCQVGQSNWPALQGLERHSDHIPAEFNFTETMALEASKPEGRL